MASKIIAIGLNIPSPSGKTTFSHRLSIQLEALGLNPHPIEVDYYFINREDSPSCLLYTSPSPRD